MSKVAAWCSRNRPYLATVGLGILGLLWNEGVVSDTLAGVLGPLLGGWAGLEWRAKLKKPSP